MNPTAFLLGVDSAGDMRNRITGVRMRHKAGKENETQTKHTGRNIVIAVVVVLAAFCAYAAALVHSITSEFLRTFGFVLR